VYQFSQVLRLRIRIAFVRAPLVVCPGKHLVIA